MSTLRPVAASESSNDSRHLPAQFEASLRKCLDHQVRKQIVRGQEDMSSRNEHAQQTRGELPVEIPDPLPVSIGQDSEARHLHTCIAIVCVRQPPNTAALLPLAKLRRIVLDQAIRRVGYDGVYTARTPLAEPYERILVM